MEREGPMEPEQREEAAASGLPAHLAARVEAIVQAAEQEAAAARHDIAAERQAAADRLRGLTDGLRERAEAAKARLDELLALLEQTADAVREDGGDAYPEPSPPPRPSGANAAGPALGRARELSAARLIAIEMAVAGRSRDEVDRHLRETFRFDDTRALLDDVFGGTEQAG
jgi:hypothetical protein